MSRTFAHLPSRVREERGLHYDPAGTANLPTHGRSGYVRSIDRAEGARLTTSAARERRGLIRTLTTIRSLDDAEDSFGTGDRAYDPCVLLRTKQVGFRRERWQDIDPHTPIYDPAPDDEAQAIADREWEEEMARWWVWQEEREREMAERDAEFASRCPCCGRGY